MDINKNAVESIKKHALEAYPNECCGLIVNGVYHPCTNAAEDPLNDFKIPKNEYLSLYNQGVVEAVIHSHTHSLHRPENEHQIDPRTPSKNDMVSQKNTAIPWGIVSTEGETVTPIVWLGDSLNNPLIGRKFIHGINDCYSLIRDYYNQKFNIVLPDYPRDYLWWEGAGNLYVDNFANAGFETIEWQEMQPGDVLLINILAKVPNHAAIYCGEDKILHHYETRLSGTDSLRKWRSRITHVLRYRGV